MVNYCWNDSFGNGIKKKDLKIYFYGLVFDSLARLIFEAYFRSSFTVINLNRRFKPS